jgi:hypothetical protein
LELEADMAEFQPFNLGQVFATAEGIKQARAQATSDRLREQYMGEQITGMREQRDRQKRLDDVTLGKEKATQVFTMMQYASQSPNPKNFLESNAPELVKNLQANGVDWATVDDSTVKRMVQGIMAKAGAEIGQGPAPQPVQMETIQGPGGSILQRDPTTNKLNSVLSREPVGTTVNVNSKQETEESKAIGKALGQQYVEIQDAGVKATGKVNKLDRLSGLLEGVQTGKLTPKLTDFASYADAFGIKLDPKLDAKQAAQSLIGELVLQARNPSGGAGMPGAMSDADREFLKSINPSLATTPGGNKMIIDTLRKLAERDQLVAKKAREYRAKNKTLEGFSDELAQWSTSNPLFGKEQALLDAAAPQVTATGPNGQRLMLKNGKWVPLDAR